MDRKEDCVHISMDTSDREYVIWECSCHKDRLWGIQPSDCNNCPNYISSVSATRSKRTNADCVRAMGVAELATFLTNSQVEVFRRVVKEMCNLLDVSFPYEELTKEVTDKYEEMKKEQLDWLKQEASE